MNEYDDRVPNFEPNEYYRKHYAEYQVYREKQKAGYFEEEGYVSADEYDYQLGRRDDKIDALRRELDAFRNERSELDKIKGILIRTGVIHTDEKFVCLSDRIAWLIDRQEYRINELGLQVDDDGSA